MSLTSIHTCCRLARFAQAFAFYFITGIVGMVRCCDWLGVFMQHLNYNALDDSVKGFLLQGLMLIVSLRSIGQRCEFSTCS